MKLIPLAVFEVYSVHTCGIFITTHGTIENTSKMNSADVNISESKEAAIFPQCCSKRHKLIAWFSTGAAKE